jgi:quercetin dioxygenase-like cupin family protein
VAKEIFGPPTGSLVDIGEGAKVLLGGLAVQFKLRAGQTGGQLSITETTLDPHRLVPPHVHADEDEYTYVAAGTLGVRVGDEEFEAAQGCYLVKRRSVAHAFWNPTDELARTVEVINASQRSAIKNRRYERLRLLARCRARQFRTG